jgi:hypothetical protein
VFAIMDKKVAEKAAFIFSVTLSHL